MRKTKNKEKKSENELESNIIDNMPRKRPKNDIEYNGYFYDEVDGIDVVSRNLYELGIIDTDGVKTEKMKDVTGVITISGMFNCKFTGLDIIQWNKDGSDFEDFKEGVYEAADELIKQIEELIKEE